MAFPSSPSNGQRATVNDIIYEYNSTKGAWLRVSAQGFTSANLTVGGIITDNYYRADGTSLLGVNKSVYNGTATASTSVTLIDSVPSSGNTSVNWTLTSKDTDNTTYKNSVVSSLNDGTNVYYSEYGIILSNASVSVSTFTSNIVSGNIRLYAVGDSANVNITFQRTLLGTSTDVGYLTAGSRGLQGPTGNVSYGNTEVAAYLTDYTGNIGNVKTTANVVTTEYFIGNGSQLTGLPSSYGNTQVASYLTDYTGNIGNLKTTSNVITTGYFIGNGSQLTGLPISYGNTEVATYLTTYTGNLSAGATTIDGNLTVSGNLIVNGNVTYINANNVNINDSLIYLADDNPADTLDIGFVSAFTDATRYQHTGLVRDATDGVWKLFANVVAEPTTTIDFTNATYANLQIGNLISPSVYSASSGNVNLNLYSSGTGQTYVRQSTGGAYGLNLAQDIVTSGSSARIYFLSSSGHTAIYNSGGTLFFNTASNPGTSSGFPQVKITPTSPTVNWLQLTGSATGNTVPIAVDGADSNINLTLSAKGSGNITTANSVVISNSSASTSTTTGALRVSGGAGIAGNLNAGGNLTVGQNLNVSGEINTSKTVTALNILNPFLLAGM